MNGKWMEKTGMIDAADGEEMKRGESGVPEEGSGSGHGPSSPRIDAAIFDMDGTLIDSMPVWHDAGARFLRKKGITPEAHLGDKLFTLNSASGAEYLIRNYHLPMDQNAVAQALSEEMRDYYSNEAAYRPGAEKLLDQFRSAGIPMVILTSTDGYLVEIALKRVGALDYFQHIYSSGDLKLSKGEPEIFRLVLSDLGTEAGHTAVFEDGLYAIRTANSEGFFTVGIREEISAGDQEAIERKSDLYVRDLRQLSLNETEKTICITKF